MSITKKIFLNESDMPEYYYNIQADMPNPTLPPLHPGTKKPIGPEDLAPLFPMELIKQEVSQERFIEIPDEVQNIYKLYRPSPLYRATGLEKLLDTPATIYYKYEGVIIAAEYQPMVIEKDAVILIDGKVTDLSKISEAFDAGISVSFGSGFLQPWEEVDVLEYKLYMASKFDYLEAAPRDDRAGMWAFNNANEHTLRLGGDWPEDNESVEHIMSKDAKVALVAKTQHWFHKDRPKQSDTNSTWSRWIMRIRKKEPFIYLG